MITEADVKCLLVNLFSVQFSEAAEAMEEPSMMTLQERRPCVTQSCLG